MMDYIGELKEKYSQPEEPIETEQWFSMLHSGEFSHADIASLLAERDNLQNILAQLMTNTEFAYRFYWSELDHNPPNWLVQLTEDIARAKNVLEQNPLDATEK